MQARDRGVNDARPRLSGHFSRAGLLLVPLLLAGGLVPRSHAEENDVLARADAFIAEKKPAQAMALLERFLAKVRLDSADCQTALVRLQAACDGANASYRFAVASERLLTRLDKVPMDDAARRKLRLAFLRVIADYHYERRQHVAAAQRLEQLRDLLDGDEAKACEQRLAEIYEESGTHEKALEIWKKRLDAAPEDRSLRAKVAGLYFRLNRVDEGIALMNGEKDAQQLYTMAEQLYYARQFQTADALARKLIPQNPQARSLLARICFDQKQFDEAAALLVECIEVEKDDSSKVFDLAARLADVHVARNTLADAIGGAEKAIADLRAREAQAGAAPEALAAARIALRKQLAILSELKKKANDLVGAFNAMLDHRAAQVVKALPAGQKRPTDWRLSRAARPTFQQLLRDNRKDDAAALLARLDKEGDDGTWLGVIRFAVLRAFQKSAEADDVLARLKTDAGQNESKLLTLANELEDWNFDDIAADIYGMILEAKPENSIYDTNAHVRLARYCLDRSRFDEAKKHCDAVDASTTSKSTGLTGTEQFRRIEALATFRSSGNSIDELFKMLEDPRLARRIAAAELLGQYGEAEHLERIRRLMSSAPNQVRYALQQATTGILSRHVAAQKPPGPVSETEMKARIAKLGTIAWLEKDTVQPTLRWAAIEKKFVVKADLTTGDIQDFADTLEFLGHKELSARSIVFTRDRVWVGTDHGLLVFDRWAKSWNAYAVAREHLNVPVTKLLARGEQIVVTIELAGQPSTHAFNPVSGTWSKEP